MEVQVDKQGGCFCRITVQVEAAAVDAAYGKALRKVAKGARLPGFRPGKVPPALLQRQYGAQIEQEAVDAVVQGSLFLAMEQQQLVPVNTPALEHIVLRRGEPCSYRVSVEIRPDIELAHWKGLQVPAIEPKADAQAIADALEQMREQAAQTVPVQGRELVEADDWVLLDYEGLIDGAPFAGGKGENVLVDVAGKEYIEGFAEGLRGQKVPGSCTVEVKFPDDFATEKLRGKLAQFNMVLHELKRREKPALDDDFARDLGKPSLDALRQKVADDQLERARDQAKHDQQRALLVALAKAHPFDVPPSMVDRQVERTIANMARRMEMYTQRPYRFNDDQLADLRSSSREEAEFQVRAGLMIAALGRAEKIDVDDNAVRQAIDALAADAGEHAPSVHAHYRDEDRFEELRFEQLEKRVFELLLAHAQLGAPSESTAGEEQKTP